MKAVSNTASAITGTVSVATEVVADTSGLLANSIASTPGVFKALFASPFSAAKGYLMEADGKSAEEAEEAAFYYLNQDVATTIDQAGESAGKLVAKLFEDDDDEDPITTAEKKEVINE